MKMLIFSGLVLGSISYLVATQTDLLQGWADQDSLPGQELISEAPQALNPFSDSQAEQVEALKDAQFVRDLQASVAQLKAEVEQLTQALNDKKTTELEVPIEAEPAHSVIASEQPAEATPRHQIMPDSVPVSPYMPVTERSDALMDLVHRMEMKAASY